MRRYIVDLGNNMKKLFILSDENAKRLKEISTKENKSMSKIVNLLIENYFKDTEVEKSISQSIEKLNFSEDEKSKNHKIIKIKIAEKEYDILKKFALKENLNNVARYIKYLISLKIYADNSLSNLELKELDKARNEFNMLGKNLNQILKILHSRTSTNEKQNSSIKNLNELLEDINSKQNILYSKINSFIQTNKKRF
ncbi:Ribbon-helix-helix protein, copG family domain protein [Campylobacter upsaliensis RM3195]|nr:Ribbon-helix-helix protein, copG family domain protein [Campylobacter upsaliensis RM3195]